MPCVARFPTLYYNNDGRLYDKLDLISDMIIEILQFDMLWIKIASNRAHLGLGGNHSNLVDDEGLRRRTRGMDVTKHQG